MKIKDQIAIFPDNALRHVLTGSQEEIEVSEKALVPNLLQGKLTQEKVELIQKYIDCVANQKDTKHRKTASRLINYLSKGIQEKGKTAPELIQRIKTVASRLIDKKELKERVKTHESQKMEAKDFDFSQFPEEKCSLSEFEALSKNLERLAEMRMKVHVRSQMDPEISKKRKLIHQFEKPSDGNRFLNYEGQLEDNQKLVLVPSPKRDIEDAKHYWEMVMEKKVPLMISLCSPCQWKKILPFWRPETIKKISFDSGAKAKCVKTSILYTGDKKVLDKGKERTVKIVERVYKVTAKDGSKHKATHLHYLHWPDHEVAPDLAALDVLLKKRSEVLKSRDAPMAINCQGGVGRTGEIALFECCKNEIDNQRKRGVPLDKISLNLAEIIYGMRQFAPSLIGTEIEQLGQVCSLIDRYYKTLV
jgi:hypothetical protein